MQRAARAAPTAGGAKPACPRPANLLQAPAQGRHRCRSVFTDEVRGMKNFVRALRCALPYRGRLILSLLCAVFAAALWGMNFTAVYPVLKILSNNQTVQQWVDGEVTTTQQA